MKILRTLLLLFFVFAASFISAQDIHFSQFNMSPLTLNPAQTGAFEGTFRIGGIYRDQWGSFLDNQFKTPSIYVDAPIIRGFRKNDWVGVGAVLVNDKRGTGGLSDLSFALSGAYHLALGKKANTYLSLGLNYGSTTRRYTSSENLVLPNMTMSEILGTPNPVNPILTALEDGKASFSELSGGLLLNSVVSRKINFNIGFGLSHLLKANTGLIKSSTDIPLRLAVHAGANIDLTNQLELSPSIAYQQMLSVNETNIQTMLGYHLNAERDITPKIGVGYRLGNAVIPMIGFDFKGFSFGAAYDVSIGDISNSFSGNGGFEISASYIAKIFRTPVVKPTVFCPRF